MSAVEPARRGKRTAAPSSRAPKTPQEKKRLSLEKDRRNVYGENDNVSGKNIPRDEARPPGVYRGGPVRRYDLSLIGRSAHGQRMSGRFAQTGMR
jgi:hypothetical protein